MRCLRRLALVLAVLLLAPTLLLVANLGFRRHSVSREALGLSPAVGAEACRDASPPFMRVGHFISEKAASDYAPYALASLNVYAREKNRDFTLSNLTGAARSYGLVEIGKRAGLAYSVFERKGDPVEIVVAFRGTRADRWFDLWSNASWFTGVLGLQDHYATARSIFRDVRDEARRRHGQAALSFVATGHSLGGGLAQHVAAGFPCVSVVGFDPSFVENLFVYEEPFAPNRTAHVYDRGDGLTQVKRILFGAPEDSDIYRWYPLRLVHCPADESGIGCGLKRHSMLELSVGMARLVADCQVNEPRGCGANVPRDTALQDLYCRTYGRGHGHEDGTVCQASWERERGSH